MKHLDMSAEAFEDWLAEMRASRLASSDSQCARLLGVSANTLVSIKKTGADRRTALACAALLEQLEPYL